MVNLNITKNCCLNSWIFLYTNYRFYYNSCLNVVNVDDAFEEKNILKLKWETDKFGNLRT